MARIGDAEYEEDLIADGYYYALGGSEAVDIASQALGLYDIHGYDDDDIYDVTNAIALPGSDEYDEIWVTWDSHWYASDALYVLIYTSEALHRWIRDQ